MNTHDKYELPPLPQGEYRLSPDSRAPTLYDEEAMQNYARAAIEADRQRRGESVAADKAYDKIDRYLRNNLDDDDYAEYSEALGSMFAPQPADLDAATIADYEAVLSDHRRLVRELDVLLNGEEGAAEQASLCDIVAQVRREGIKTAEPVKVPSDLPVTEQEEEAWQRMEAKG